MAQNTTKKMTTPAAKKTAGTPAAKAKAPALPKHTVPTPDPLAGNADEKEELTIVPEPGAGEVPVSKAPADDDGDENGSSIDKNGDDPDNGQPKTPEEPVPSAPSFGITEKTVIVIVAEGEASDLLIRAWDKAAAPSDIRMVAPAATLAETLESLVADDLIPDEFIFVAGICFPTAKVTLADLTLYRVRILEKGEAIDNTGLPMHLTKENIIKALQCYADDAPRNDEDLVTFYNAIAHEGEIPNNVSYHFGNVVSYGLRPDFCTARLLDALHFKKFICLTPEAFPTAKRFLEEYAKR